MNKKCAVYCTADDNYIFPSIVALQSVRRFHPECDFFVIGNQSIISKNKLGVLKRFNIHFLHSDRNELFAGSHWPSTCYLALLGPEMLWEKGYEYSLGLDADILCVQPLDLDEVFSMTVGYAGIENQRARKGNFKDPDFVRRKYGLSDNDLDGHNTNTGVVFWNNKAVADSKLGERSIKCFQECFSEDSRMIRGDQSLFALVSILEPALPWLILPRGYNYRIHNVDDQKEDIKEGDIRIYHFIGPKPWESISVRQRLLNPSVVSHRDKWFAFVDEQGIFNRDLTPRNRRLWERISKPVSYWWDDRMAAIIIKEPALASMARFAVRVSGFAFRKAKGVFRKAKAILQLPVRFSSKQKATVDEVSYFYKLSPTCQVPKLALIYEQYFGRRTDGCFVEVGAYDGEYASNTSGLADIGWSSYYIEPMPEYSQRCKARHARNKNITVSQCAIGPEPGEVEINVGGPLSTIRDDVKQNFESLDWARGNFTGEKVRVHQLTLEEYLVKHGVKPQFELLVVDVEGYEWNVLRNFDIQKWQPQMVVIELHDQNDDYLLLREELNNVVRYFDDNGYKVIYKDFSNTIYVPKDSYPRFSYRT